MIEEQKSIGVTPAELVEKVQVLFNDGWRLVQIGCTRLENGLELNYSFDKHYQFFNLKVAVALSNPEVPSISPVYWSAFIYENETQDLFGIKFPGLVLDYKGSFYKTSVKNPFNSCSEQINIKDIKKDLAL
ncbi:MAG: NADH-quinone oxidoreductase subunit C [Candidatus Omnitrophica bacterium]|nr:NADH-quinone oxidoreductase subunit C [Candidatus Omnitrophota bacterium]